MGVLGNMVWALRLLFCWAGCLSAQNTGPGIPHYLASTFFGGANRISVPRIPNSISDPALNAPTFVPFQGSLSHQPQAPLVQPLNSPVLRTQNQPQFTPLSPAEVRPNTGAVFGAPFVSLGQPAPQQLPVSPALPQVEPLRSVAEAASPGPGSFTQVVPGPAGQVSALKESLGQALEQATNSVQFSLPPGDSPGADNFGPPSITPGHTQRQTLNSAPVPSIPNPTVSQSSLPGLGSFNQFRSGGQPNQISLGQALEQASQAAQLSLPAGGSPGPQGGPPPSIGQGPDSPQTSRVPSPQQFNSPSLLSPGPGFSSPPQLDLEEALAKASEEALGRAGPQLSNIGPVIPAVPVGPSESSPAGSFRLSESNLFRGNTGSPSAPLIRQQSIGSPNGAQSRPPLVFDATSAGSDFDRQPFRSDPKISEQRIQSSGERASTKIFLGSTRLSETPRSSSLFSESGRNKVPIPVKSCTKTFHEECHNEYKMVCEETFTEREKYECNIVEETKCEKGVTTEYEPACFQQILDTCESICKRGIQPNCMPQCARSLGKTSCHKVKVVTPHTTCAKVPREVCENVKKRVPYEKCHDVPKKVCEQVPREVCK